MGVLLTASATDQGDDAVRIDWDFDAAAGCAEFESDAAGPRVRHAFDDDGDRGVCVRAIDDDGGVTREHLVVTLDNVAPVAVPPDTVRGAVAGEQFTVVGGGTDVPGDEIVGYRWEMLSRRCAVVAVLDDHAILTCDSRGLFGAALYVTDDDGAEGGAARFQIVVNPAR